MSQVTDVISALNSLDLIVITAVVAYAVCGFMQGLVVNLSATIGLICGGVAALLVVPRVMDDGQRALSTSLIALGLVIGAAAIGQAIGTLVGSELRGGVRRGGLHGLDAIGGSVLSAVAVLAAAWALGYSVSGSQLPYLAQASRESAILKRVNSAMPAAATTVVRSFNEMLNDNLFPRYIDPFETEDITRVGPPDDATLQRSGVRAAAGSVLKVLGEAQCGDDRGKRGIEGTGFAYRSNRIMTNAHVVAGVATPTVETGGDRRAARVVLFDPALDVAVLAVDGPPLRPLQFAPSAQAGDKGAVLGYPENGPYDVRAARIRDRITMKSPDIYNEGSNSRDTFAIRSLVRSGNSGGPLVLEDGKVAGVIYAASISDSATGYALTADEVRSAAQTGATASKSVSTQSCAAG